MAKKGRPVSDKPMRETHEAPGKERMFDISDFPQLASATRAFHDLNLDFEKRRGPRDIEGIKRILGNAGTQRDFLVEWLTGEDFPVDAKESAQALLRDYDDLLRTAEGVVNGTLDVSAGEALEEAVVAVADEEKSEREIASPEAVRRGIERMSMANLEVVEEYSRLLVSAEAAFESLIDGRRNITPNQARVDFNRISSAIRPSVFARVQRRLTPEVSQTISDLYDKFVDAKKRASLVIDDVSALKAMSSPRPELNALLIILETRSRMSGLAAEARAQLTQESFSAYQETITKLQEELDQSLLGLPANPEVDRQIALLAQITQRLSKDFTKRAASEMKRRDKASAKEAAKSATESQEIVITEAEGRAKHEATLEALSLAINEPFGASYKVARERLDQMLKDITEQISENPYYWQVDADGRILNSYNKRSSLLSAVILGREAGEERSMLRNPEEFFAAMRLLRRVGERYEHVSLEEFERHKSEAQLLSLNERIDHLAAYLDEHHTKANIENARQQLYDLDAEIRLQINEALDVTRAVIGSQERDVLRRDLIKARRRINIQRERLEALAAQSSQELPPLSRENALVHLPRASEVEDDFTRVMQPKEDEAITQITHLLPSRREEGTDADPVIAPDAALPKFVAPEVTPDIAPPMMLDDIVDGRFVSPPLRSALSREVIDVSEDDEGAKVHAMPAADIAESELVEATKLDTRPFDSASEVIERSPLGDSPAIELNKDGQPHLPKDGKPLDDLHSGRLEGKYPPIVLLVPRLREPRSEPLKSQTVTPAKERAEAPAKPSFFGRLSSGLKYLTASRWLPSVTESETWRVHVKGELAPEELGERQLSRFGYAAKMTGALISGAMSYAGVAIVPDALRYVSQSMYTKAERDALTLPVQELVQAAENNESLKALEERANKLRNKVIASRYLSPEKKQELLDKLQGTAQAFTQARLFTRERHAKEVARLIEEGVKTRVTGMKVAKEAANSALMLAGVGYLRGPAYGVFSLVERWQKVTREVGEGKRSGGKVKALLLDGFRDWARAFSGKEGTSWTARRLSQVQAVGTLARAVGLTAATLEGLPALDAAKSLLEAFAQKSELVLPQLPVIEAAELAPVATEANVSAMPELMPEVSAESQAEVTPLVGEVEAMNIPPESIVTAKDGVTFPMYRLVREHPEVYGYNGNGDEASVDQFARSFVYKIAKRDGFLDTWLLEQGAVGRVAILPVQEAGVWHASFVDMQTSETLTGQELLERKILAPARAT